MDDLNKDFLNQLPEAARWKVIKDEQATRYARFRKKYFDDPVGFAHDCLPVTLRPYQADLMNLVVSKGKVSARSAHGCGKTTTSAILMLWFALTRDIDWDWKVISTASNFRQLEKYLFPELKRWAKLIDWAIVGREPFDDNKELLKLSLNLSTGAATAVSSTSGEGIEGVHAESLLYIIDEAKIVPDDVFDAVEGALSNYVKGGKAHGFVLSVSTPGAPAGRFYDIQMKKPAFDDWYVRHITLEEGVEAGQISPDWAEKRKIQWGEKSAIYRSKVLGEFTESSEDGLIPVYWIELANDRWRDIMESGGDFGSAIAIGVDIAGRGKDKTKIAYRRKSGVSEIEELDEEDVMATTMIIRSRGEHGGYALVVDQIGIGEGVYSRLKELGSTVIPFNSANKSVLNDISGELEFANMRAAGYWRLREMLDPSNLFNIALPPNDELMAELSQITYEIDKNKIKLESKKDFKKRIGRSPDTADAVVYSFAFELLEAEIAKKIEIEKKERFIKPAVPNVRMIGTGQRDRMGRSPGIAGRRGNLGRGSSFFPGRRR